jgi:hypothetical protein
MFKKLAKFRSLELWPTTPRRAAARSQLIPCNDNGPGRVRPEGQSLHAQQNPARRLACRWSVARDGRLECRWEFEPTDGWPSEKDLPERLAIRPPLAARRPMRAVRAAAR